MQSDWSAALLMASGQFLCLSGEQKVISRHCVCVPVDGEGRETPLHRRQAGDGGDGVVTGR